MNNKFIITLIALLLILPSISAQVRVQLGEPYVNIEELSEIEFTAHSDYYEICSLDETVIPILIKNENKFPDTFSFEVDKEYVSLPVGSTVLKSGKSAVLPLIVRPPIELEENTTLMLDIITKREALKRSVIIKANVKKCYLFNLEIDKEQDEICGCDKETYSLTLDNGGENVDIFTLNLNLPEWVNSSLDNDTIELRGKGKKEIRLEANPPCQVRGAFIISAEAISEKTEMTLSDTLELTVLPQNVCYNTVISADDVDIDYFGKNIPITIENYGVKDATYSLIVEGVDWYSLSQTDFSLKKGGEKTINLALYPDENVVEGDYNVDIKARTDSQEFTKSITVKLERKGVVFEKIGFYVNYFRYYIGMGVVLLLVLFFLVLLLKRRIKKKTKKAKPKIKEEKKIEEKKLVEKSEKPKLARKVKKTKRKWLSFIVYLILLVLLLLIIFTIFRYGLYYKKALNFISRLFTNYAVPYGYYLKYAILVIGVLVILILIIDFIRKKPKKRKIEKKEKIKKEKPKERKIEIKKVAKKGVKKRKLRLFEYIYLVLVILLFLAIIVYAVYRFSGRTMPVRKLGVIMIFLRSYYLYFIIGIATLILLIAAINFVKKIEKKPRRIREKKVAKKSKKRSKKFIKILVILISGLIVLSGIIYSFIYYNLIDYIRDLFIVYYPYILMGAGLLIILILILHFHSKNIS